MNVFSVVFAELKGVLGKAYLLAGLIPALLFVFVWTWFQGNSSLASVIAHSIPTFENGKIAGAMSIVLGSLALALLLFAAREQIVVFVQTVPGWPLAPLRALLFRRQTSRLRRAEQQADEFAFLLTITAWARTHSFEPPTSVPEGETSEAAIEASSLARKLIERHCHRRLFPSSLPSAQQRHCIVIGLRRLYVLDYETNRDPSCQRQIEEWRNLLRHPRAIELLRQLDAAVNRRYVEARLRLDTFPEPKWLRPTILGTRAAALDDYAQFRYGIDTSTILARLIGVLDDKEKTALSDARLSIEVLINLSVVSFVLLIGVAWTGAWSIFDSWRSVDAGVVIRIDWRTLAFLVGAFAACTLFYRAAVVASSSFESQVIRLVDLRRLDLIEKLGFAPPENVRQERELWSDLQRFFADAQPLDPCRPIQRKKS